MPFIKKSYDKNIPMDLSKVQPVTVIANFNTQGKFIPVYFRYVAGDESEHNIKVEGIRYTKENPITKTISFCCSITNYGHQKDVMLIYHIVDHIWYLNKI